MDPQLLFSRWSLKGKEKSVFYKGTRRPRWAFLNWRCLVGVADFLGVSQNTGVEVTRDDTFDVSISTTCLLGCFVYRTGSVGEG